MEVEETQAENDENKTVTEERKEIEVVRNLHIIFQKKYSRK